jgi:F-type H+-transporting ATPase subunit delta
MAEKITIARPYAKAAFEHAREEGAFAPWSEMLAKAAAVVADARVARLLLNPLVAPADLVGLISDVSGADAGGSLDEQMRNFLDTLAQNRRLGLLPEIATSYELLRAEVENVADVHVTSAAPLDDGQRQRLLAALKKRLRREVRLHCDVDATLIGGAIVRAGDFVIDGSMKARLDRLAVEIAH